MEVTKQNRLTKTKGEILNKYKWASAVILLPILLWPLIFFGTIFFFDDPNANPTFVWALFIGVNAYPLYLIALYFLNLKIFKRFGNFGYLLPCLIIGVIGITIFSQVISSIQFKEELENKKQERKDAGFIKDSRTYKIVNDSLYFNDRYFEGDHKTFEPLGFHYGKDKFNAYRQDKIIKGAKSTSFRIVQWQWQRDNENFYFKGEKLRGIDLSHFKRKPGQRLLLHTPLQ